MEIEGGPDALRAVWPTGDVADGPLTAAGGDTHIVYADWPEEGGDPEIRTIHQFGSATLDENSPHYADQAPIFLDGGWKRPPMTLDGVLAEATRDYRVGAGAE
jgi:penicillin amidase/acyl-homoserine-lactone acylase